jgi:very-short-patch-repair endonuclease
MHITLQRDHARSLRKNMPPAERIIWSRLKQRGLMGYRFNRQVEVGRFIVDFLCREKRLIFEIDGDSHCSALQTQADVTRSAYLEVKGFVIVRAWNTEVYSNLEGVLDNLLSVLQNR